MGEKDGSPSWIFFDACPVKQILTGATGRHLSSPSYQKCFQDPQLSIAVLHRLGLFSEDILKLEDMFKARFVRFMDISAAAKCERHIISYFQDLKTLREDYQEALDEIQKYLDVNFKPESGKKGNPKVSSKIKSTLLELGPWCAQQVALDYETSQISKKRKSDEECSRDGTAKQSIMTEVAPKLTCLIDLLRRHSHSKTSTLIVVEQNSTAVMMGRYLEFLACSNDPELSHVKVRVSTGSSKAPLANFGPDVNVLIFNKGALQKTDL